MKTSRRSLVLLATVTGPFLAGCAMETGEPEDIVTIEPDGSPLLEHNALSLNALSLNALSLNALSLNALSLNAMPPEAVASIQDPGPNGALARHAMRYIVSCAMDSSVTFDFAWTDGAGVVHAESYPGSLGLTPSWSQGGINPHEARWVSACLASRANWYGVPVLLSMRGSHSKLKQVDADELAGFVHREGAFWANLFSTTPTAYACYDPAGIEYARSQQRDCAAGHLDAQGAVASCGIIQIVGSCAQVCSKVHSQFGYWMDCAQGGEAPITTYLE